MSTNPASNLPNMISIVLAHVSSVRKEIKSRHVNCQHYEVIRDGIVEKLEIDVSYCATGAVCAYFGIKYNCGKKGRELYCRTCSAQSRANNIINHWQRKVGGREEYFIRNFGCSIIVLKRVNTRLENGTVIAEKLHANCPEIKISCPQNKFDMTPWLLLETEYDVITTSQSSTLVAKSLFNENMATIDPEDISSPSKKDTKWTEYTQSVCGKHFCEKCSDPITLNAFLAVLYCLKKGCAGDKITKYLGKDIIKSIWQMLKPTRYEFTNSIYDWDKRVHYAPAIHVHIAKQQNINNYDCPTKKYERGLELAREYLK